MTDYEKGYEDGRNITIERAIVVVVWVAVLSPILMVCKVLWDLCEFF